MTVCGLILEIYPSTKPHMNNEKSTENKKRENSKVSEGKSKRKDKNNGKKPRGGENNYMKSKRKRPRARENKALWRASGKAKP